MMDSVGYTKRSMDEYSGNHGAGKQQKSVLLRPLNGVQSKTTGEGRNPGNLTSDHEGHRDRVELEPCVWERNLTSSSYMSRKIAGQRAKNALRISSEDCSLNEKNSHTNSFADPLGLSNSTSSVGSQSRKQVYGTSRRTNLIKCSTATMRSAIAERVRKQKENSFAFSFSQTANADPHKTTTVDSCKSSTGLKSRDHFRGETNKAKRPATPHCSLFKSDQRIGRSSAASSITYSMNDSYQVCNGGDESIAKDNAPSKDADYVLPSQLNEQVNSNSESPKTAYRDTATFSSPLYFACGAALSVVEKIGSAVEYCADEVNKMTMDDDEIAARKEESEISRMPSLDTVDEHLLNEIDRLNRMNSWETNGTLSTMNTVNTADTGTSEVSFDDTKTIMSGMDDDGILISEQALKAHETRKKKRQKKKKKKRHKKAVNFQYPPCSSMKGIPRVSSEERKKMFFSQSELDEYERDRKYNLCDDVEVVAIDFSESEESTCSSSSEEDSDSDRGNDASNMRKVSAASETIATESNLKPSLRVGKYSQPFFNINGSKNKNALHGSTSAKQDGRRSLSKRANQASINMSPSNHRSKNEAKAGGTGGKIKGVQIYLRQRSVR